MYSQSVNMKLHCWALLLLCLSAKAENTAVYIEPGEVFTLTCSSAGCPNSIEGSNAMYLYHTFKEREEVFYYFAGSPDKVTPRRRYENRVQTKGSLKNHVITISNLTVDDSGIYSCVYSLFPKSEVQCNVYSLFVRGAAPCSGSAVTPCSQSENKPCDEKSLPLTFIIFATTTISILVITIFIMLIIPKVKRWIGDRRTPRNVPQVSNDYVYEVMTKNGLRSPNAPEERAYDFA